MIMRLHANPRRSALLGVLAIGAATALAGCYTVLRHPPTAEVAEDTGSRRDCYECHGPGGTAHLYDPLAVEGFDYFNDYWFPYYAYPWWYRDYWYSDQYDHADGGGGGGGGGGIGSTADNDDSRRHLWGRGSVYGPPSLPGLISQPSLPQVPTTSQPPPTPPTPPKEEESQGQQPGRTMKGEDNPNPGNQNQGGEQPKKEDKNKDTDKKRDDSKKDSGNVWRRGGGQ